MQVYCFVDTIMIDTFTIRELLIYTYINHNVLAVDVVSRSFRGLFHVIGMDLE